MILIFITLIAMLAMAKHPKRRRRAMGRYIRGAVDEELNLSTLASKTLVSVIFDNVVNERTLVSSIVATWAMQEFTSASGDGPIMVGVAHSDYSDTEMEEYLESTGSWNEGDQIAQEQGRRKVRRIGIFETPQGATDAVTLNDGKAIKTKLNWILLQGQSLRLWGYNLGTSPLASSNPLLSMQGHVNLFPK